MTRLRNVIAALMAFVMSSCLVTPAPIVQQPMTTRPKTPPPATPNGSIYQASAVYRPLFEDRRARNVGDTLVIQISENNLATKQSSSSAERSGSIAANANTLFGVPGKSFQGLNVDVNSDNKFAGTGASALNNVFTGNIAVTVIEVLPNGNLAVSGEKQIALNQGSEFIRVSGVVNPATVSPQNTVASAQVADARIEYRQTGYINDAQVMGWLARFFMTFIPF